MSSSQCFADSLRSIVGDTCVLTGEQISDDYAHDEALSAVITRPDYVVFPSSSQQVAEILRRACEEGIPVTARGSATGLSGAARPYPHGLVISFQRMNQILHIDPDNYTAHVQPGVNLAQLDNALAPHNLVYTVFPGELSASIGGNVGTNAGGMRAVKYGVTRQNVLGLQAVLPNGQIIRTGGDVTKLSTGYDLTQLIIGSESTLAIVTEITLRLYPRLAHQATILIPFQDPESLFSVITPILAASLGTYLLEYLDQLTLLAIQHQYDLSLGISETIRNHASAYLVIGIENSSYEHLHDNIAVLAELTQTHHGLECYVLEGNLAHTLITAREQAFWVAKALGADDIVDTVVPRTVMYQFLTQTQQLAHKYHAQITGCGHAGDGNVHLAIFCHEDHSRRDLLHDIFHLAIQLGGAISGEHGLGKDKSHYYWELEDPATLALISRIKEAFDPAGILNPGVICPPHHD